MICTNERLLNEIDALTYRVAKALKGLKPGQSTDPILETTVARRMELLAQAETWGVKVNWTRLQAIEAAA